MHGRQLGRTTGEHGGSELRCESAIGDIVARGTSSVDKRAMH